MDFVSKGKLLLIVFPLSFPRAVVAKAEEEEEKVGLSFPILEEFPFNAGREEPLLMLLEKV